MELTQRQIAILEEASLPTDYSQLLTSQKRDIMAIEEMLCYLEDTYQTEVEYVSFTQGSPINDEALLAKMNGVTVKLERYQENGRYVYKDNYADVLAVPKYENKVAAYFREEGLDVKVFAEVWMIDKEQEDVLAQVSAVAYIFICEDLDRGTLKKVAEEYAQWCIPQLKGRPNNTEFYIVSSERFSKLDATNYQECQHDVPRDQRVLCMISTEGSPTIK